MLVPLKAAARNSFVSTFHCVSLLHKENYTHLAGGFASSLSLQIRSITAQDYYALSQICVNYVDDSGHREEFVTK